jgi:quinol monooxygenase YgiN
MTRRAVLVFVLIGILVPLAARAQEKRSQVQSEGGSTEKGNTMRYGLSGKFITKPGQRDAFVALLLRGVDELKALGCDLYVVSISKDHPDAVFVTEVWSSPEAHRASLELPSVKAAIAEARPMLAGAVEMVELSVAGGLGIPK